MPVNVYMCACDFQPPTSNPVLLYSVAVVSHLWCLLFFLFNQTHRFISVPLRHQLNQFPSILLGYQTPISEGRCRCWHQADGWNTHTLALTHVHSHTPHWCVSCTHTQSHTSAWFCTCTHTNTHTHTVKLYCMHTHFYTHRQTPRFSSCTRRWFATSLFSNVSLASS